MLTHVCKGVACCKSNAHSQGQARQHMQSLISAIKRSVLNKDNWLSNLSWQTALWFFIMGSGMHNTLVQAFLQAFGSGTTFAGPDVNEDDLLFDNPLNKDAILGSKSDEVREQLAHSLKVAVSFMSSSVFDQVWMMQLCLQPQRELMESVVHAVSVEWEAEQLLKEHHGHCCETELFRSNILRYFMRPCAVVFQLVELRVKHFPYRHFSLLHPAPNRQELAETLLAVPKCMQDTFAQHVLDAHKTPAEAAAELAGEESHPLAVPQDHHFLHREIAQQEP